MTYQPKPDSLAERALAWLAAHAPAGGEVWHRSSAIAHAIGCAIEIVPTRLDRAVTAGLVLKRFDKGECEWQHGGIFPEVPAAVVVVEPAEIVLPSEPLKTYGGMPFQCGIFSDGRATIQKAFGVVELDRDELLELYEHITPYAMRAKA